MNFPICLQSIEPIEAIRHDGQRWLIAFYGVPGWCREFSYGLCVALAIERPSIDDEWLARSCLWIASMPDSLDDCLVVEGGRVLLVRRYEIETPSLELNVRINQQLAVARWFSTQGNTRSSIEKNTVGRLV